MLCSDQFKVNTLKIFIYNIPCDMNYIFEWSIQIVWYIIFYICNIYIYKLCMFCISIFPCRNWVSWEENLCLLYPCFILNLLQGWVGLEIAINSCQLKIFFILLHNPIIKIVSGPQISQKVSSKTSFLSSLLKRGHKHV